MGNPTTEQQNVLSTRYGLISDVLGRRCPAFDPQCMTCVAWAMSDEIERLRHDLEIQTVNATAVLQAQHERDCAVEDVKRLSEALECLLPGLILDLRYATDDDDKDAMRSRVKTVQDALAGPADDVGGGGV